MRSLHYLEEAAAELRQAVGWYSEQQQSLGVRFLRTIDILVDTIRKDPERFPIVHQDIRRALIRRFPYGIHFAVRDETILILAVFHAKRNPESWKSR